MNIGNINQNYISHGINSGKTAVKRESGPKDVFVKTSPRTVEPSMKNLAQNYSAKDAGNVLLADCTEMIRKKTIETPAWKIKGGILEGSNMVYDKKNKCIYCSLETKDSSGRKKYHLTCLNTDGSVRWKAKRRSSIKLGPVLGGDGNIYFTGNNDLFVVDKDGNKKWNLHLDNTKIVDGNPVVSSDGTVFLVTRKTDEDSGLDRTIHAVKDGKVSWTCDTTEWTEYANSMLTGKDGSLYITGREIVKETGINEGRSHPEYYFMGLKSDGTQKFRFQVENWPNTWTGSLSEGPDGTIYTLQNDGFIKAYSPDGTEKFSRQITQKGKPGGKGNGLSLPYPPIIDDSGNLYMIASRGWQNELICLDKEGNDIWRNENENSFATKPSFMPDGNIAIGDVNEQVQIFTREGKPHKTIIARDDKNSGNDMEREPVEMYDIAISENGRVFVSTEKQLLAFDTGINLEERLLENAKKTENSSLAEKTIRMEEETVIIGGVKVRRNKTEQ